MHSWINNRYFWLRRVVVFSRHSRPVLLRTVSINLWNCGVSVIWQGHLSRCYSILKYTAKGRLQRCSSQVWFSTWLPWAMRMMAMMMMRPIWFFFFFNQPTNANVIFWLKQVTVQRPYFDLQHAKPRYGNEILMDKDRKLLKMLLKSFEVIMVSSLKKGEDEILEVLKCFKLFNFGCHSQKKNCHGNVAVVAWDHS